MYLSKLLRNLGVVVLLVLPFQGLAPTLMGLHEKGDLVKQIPVWIKAFSYLDEFSFFIFLGIAFTFFCIKPRVYKLPHVPLTKWLIAFVTFGFLLAAVKTIPPAQAMFGIYDLVKNICVLYLFAMIHYSETEFMSIIRWLIRVGVVLAVFAIIGEVLALALNWGMGYLVVSDTRLGLYRVISLAGFGNHNFLGFYGILVFFLILATAGSGFIKYSKIGSVFIMIALTLSRQVWFGFVLMFTSIKQRIIPFFPILMLLGFLIFILMGQEAELDPVTNFRLFALLESLKILAKHPFTGLGPGMFGDLASILWQSPVYDNWPIFYEGMVFRNRSIDMFWPVVWGGYGLVGLALYGAGWVSLFLFLGKGARMFKNDERHSMFQIGKTLQYYLVVLILMGMASGLNAAFVAYTYFALVGVFISLYQRHEAERFRIKLL